ncbi:unnamed protein product [Candidula unifasciata]|uniref:Transcription elongation factor A N-terminal and central domain-containing protein 2 n=1 Tax=Candidula unifasciata TaxID=100452 RepID=A0A8S3Z1F1_9EUPU|nr:unnamed protein product [Candidula unifasciata]
MDKFLVKTPRVKSDTGNVASSSRKQLKQKTIHSLKGVVVVEDIERLKSKLELSSQSTSVLISSLQQLGKKIPPRNVLVSTKIGHTVNKLRRHPEEDVAKEAKAVYIKWKHFYKEHLSRPQIEVMCDTKTQNFRNRGKKLLSEALRVEIGHEIIEAVEKEAFYQHRRLISPAYRRSVRNMVFKLMHTDEVRNSLLGGQLSVEDFVKQHNKV